MAGGVPERCNQDQNQMDTGENSEVINLPESYPSCFQKYLSCRWRIGVTVTLLHSTNLCQKQTMSFALVCMTGGRGGYRNNSSLSNGTDTYEFDWDSQTQGVILSTSFYGAIVAPFFAGPAVRRFGAKLTIQASMMMIAIMSCLSPLAARSSVGLLIANRVVLGFFTGNVDVFFKQGFVNPATHDLWVPWFPGGELSQVVSMAFAGYHTASIVTFAISGILCTITLDNGWPFIFYFFGGYAVLNVVLCQVTIYNTPHHHPFLSVSERTYILRERRMLQNSKKTEIPWRPMLLSGGVWCYLLTISVEAIVWAVYPSFLPLYFSVYLDFPYEQNGLLLSVTFLCKFFAVFIWSTISTMLIKRMSTTVNRKVIFTAGKILTIGVTIGVAFVKASDRYLAYGLLLLSSLFEPSNLVALTSLPMDLAPRYASIIGAAGEIARGIGLTVCPIALSLVIPDRTEEQWMNLFIITSAIMAGNCIFFDIFANAELQPWAVSTKDSSISDIAIDEVQTVTKRLEDGNGTAVNMETLVSKL